MPAAAPQKSDVARLDEVGRQLPHVQGWPARGRRHESRSLSLHQNEGGRLCAHGPALTLGEALRQRGRDGRLQELQARRGHRHVQGRRGRRVGGRVTVAAGAVALPADGRAGLRRRHRRAEQRGGALLGQHQRGRRAARRRAADRRGALCAGYGAQRPPAGPAGGERPGGGGGQLVARSGAAGERR
eukprot:4323791-Prymnesium_polylepis.1